MAITAKLDKVYDLSAQEVDGVLVSLRRMARVSELTETDFTVLFQALDNVGLSVGSQPDDGDYPNADNLILAERNPRLVDGDKTKVDVELIYKHFNDAPFSGDLNSNTGRQIPFKTKTALQQVTVNKYPDDMQDENGNASALAGQLIQLSHTFPDGTNNYTYQKWNATTNAYDTVTLDKDEKYGGETKTQTGEVTYLRPEDTIYGEGYIDTDTPWEAKAAFKGKVNRETWQGYAARTLLCTVCDYEAYNFYGSTIRYKFTFEFQENPDGWDQTAVFIDHRTGKPPLGLVENTGYKTITALQSTPKEAFDNYLKRVEIA